MTVEEQKQALRRRGICVIIPTFNNAGTIVDVVSRAMEQCSDVFVVSDGCTDNTLELISKMPVQPRLVILPENSGKGTALKKGFKAASDAGFAYAISLDADAQHYPEDIPLFLQANIENPDALIVGERKGLESVERSSSSKFANSFSNFWFTVQTGLRLKDTQTGYRLYPLKRLHGLPLLTSRYEAELELLVFAAWHGTRIVSLPVNVFYPSREERVSHFRPVRDFTRISVLNTVLCVLALVYALPLFILRTTFKLLRTYVPLLLFMLVAMFIISPGTWIYMSIGAKSERKKEKLHEFVCNMCRFALRIASLLGIRYSQDGAGEEALSSPCVVICNHQSHLDLLPVLAYSPRTVILTADWVWNNPLYKYVIRSMDFLPASRGVEALLPEIEKLAEKGYSVVIFPEGTRATDCRIGRFHQGAFFLAEKLNLDILPLILYGTGRALPKHARILKSWEVRLETDRRISPGEIESTGASNKEQASWMRKYYKRRYSEIADKIEQTLS